MGHGNKTNNAKSMVHTTDGSFAAPYKGKLLRTLTRERISFCSVSVAAGVLVEFCSGVK